MVLARLRECPNCGQHTGRTEDWACQWCGYPVLSESYKKIEGTFELSRTARLSDGGPHTDAMAAGPCSELAAAGPMPETVSDVAPDALPGVAPELEPDLADAEQQEPEDADETAADANPREYDEPVPEPLAGERAEAAPRAEVTVRELCAEFLDCGMEAHEEFRGRSFRLTGVADTIIIKDIVGRYQLALTDSKPHPLGDVFCTFGKTDAPLLARVEVGRQVTVDGTYFGFTSNIILTGCSMVS